MFWIYHIRCEDFNRDLERFKENLNDPERVLDCISRSAVNVAEVLKEKYIHLRCSLLSLLPALLFEVLTIIVFTKSFLLLLVLLVWGTLITFLLRRKVKVFLKELLECSKKLFSL